jgi:hypothetical protein
MSERFDLEARASAMSMKPNTLTSTPYGYLHLESWMSTGGAA